MELEEDYSSEQYNDNLEMQIAEVEILQSMFPGSQELNIDPSIIHEVVAWVNLDCEETKEQTMPSLIDFTLRMGCGPNMVEVVVTLPAEYPKYCVPEVYVRSNELSREGQTRINEDIGDFLEQETIPEEPCVVGVISWLQENSESYFVKEQLAQKSNIKKVARPSKADKFLRFWVYSHHIYSKIKRKNILDLADEFKLTGFCLPGKPGLICVEGNGDMVTDWWAVVRNWNWKKINVKIQEEEEVKSENECLQKRIFSRFEEIGVVKETLRGNHMDMGEFYKYLEIHDAAWAFKELFGIEKS